MTRVCLDTSAYSHFCRGVPAVVDAVAAAHEIGVPVVVLGELFVGFRRGARSAENHAALERFLARSVVRVLPVDVETAVRWARLVEEARADGHTVPTNDLWIAATAARHGMSVLTCDSDFGRLRVDHVLLGR